MGHSSDLFLIERENQQENNLLNFSKSQLIDKATEMVSLVESGNIDPIQALIAVKKQLQLWSEVETKVRVVAEANMNIPKGGQEFYGCKVEEAAAGGKFDYTVCGDKKLGRLTTEMEQLQAEVKARQDILKNSKFGDVMVDEVTGESYELQGAPIKVGGKTTVKITIK